MATAKVNNNPSVCCQCKAVTEGLTSLQCKHLFCEACISQFESKTTDGKEKVCCPLCTQNIIGSNYKGGLNIDEIAKAFVEIYRDQVYNKPNPDAVKPSDASEASSASPELTEVPDESEHTQKNFNNRSKGESAIIQLPYNGTNGLAESKSFRVVNVDLKQMALNGAKKISDFKLEHPHYSHQRMCLFKNQIWCPCYKKDEYNCINVYTMDGKQENNIKLDGIDQPEALYPLDEQQMLVASSSGLHILDVDSEKITSEVHSEACMQDVCVNNSKIAVTGLHNVFILQATAPFEELSTFEHEGCVLSILMQNGHVFTTSSSTNQTSQYSEQGQLLGQHGSKEDTNSDELYKPFICAIDNRGTKLVADNCNHRLIVESDEGEWTVIKDVKVQYASDVLISDGYMYVCHGMISGDKYIQKYQVK